MSSSARAYVRNNHLALVALAVAVVGVPSAWALARNSVGSPQIKPNAVKNADIADDAVTSSKVDNGSLLTEDFAEGEIPAGDQGPPGPEGPQGTPGSALAYAHVLANESVDSANSRNISAVANNNGGVICLNVTAAQAPQNVVATLDIATGQAIDQIRASLEPNVVNTNCGGGPADLVVETTTTGTFMGQEFQHGVADAFYVTVN